MTTLTPAELFQTTWGHLCFVIGLLGNPFIIYATIGYRAIKLDSMSVWIINNLAVVDTANCLMVLLPQLVQQHGKLQGFVLFNNNTFHDVYASYFFLFLTANGVLVNFLSVNKLLRCVFPLKNLHCSFRQKVALSVVTYLLSIIPTIYVAYGWADGFMSASEEKLSDLDYLGFHGFGNSEFKENVTSMQRNGLHAILVIFNALPCVTVIALNLTLIAFAAKMSNAGIKRTNIVIVIMVTASFLISVFPNFITQIFSESQAFKEVSLVLLFTISAVNPFIYFALNPTFRKFSMDFLCGKNPTAQTVGVSSGYRANSASSPRFNLSQERRK